MFHSNGSGAGPGNWLVFVYQVPARSSSVRVRVWRRLQALGAVQIRQSAYVLPNRDQPREDLEWLKTEVESLGGRVTLFVADTVGRASHDEIVGAFRAARGRDVAALATRAARWLRRAGSTASRQTLPGSSLMRARALLDAWHALQSVTYFDVPASSGLERTMEQVSDLVAGPRDRRPSAAPAARLDPAAFTGRRWVTRPCPGVDRMSSAWLIRRFIDPKAVFEFADEVTEGAVPFDMFGVEFGHQGDACSFEVLAARFDIADAAARWIGRMVHDIDLHDNRFGEPETTGVASMVEGLRLANPSDAELLDRGIALFESLARAYAARRTGEGAAGLDARQKDLPRNARRRRRGRLGSR